MTDQPFISRPAKVVEAAALALPVNPFGALSAGLPQVLTTSDYVIDGYNHRHRDLRKAFGSGHVLLYDAQAKLLGSLPVFLCLQASPEPYGRARNEGFRLYNRKRGWAGRAGSSYISAALGAREGMVITDPTVNLVADCIFPDESGLLPNDRPEAVPRFTPVREGRIHEAFLWVTEHSAQEVPLTTTTLPDLGEQTPRQFDATYPEQPLVWLTLPMGPDQPLKLATVDVSLTSGLMLLEPICIELGANGFSAGSAQGAALAVLPQALACGASVDTLPDNTRHSGALTPFDPETAIGGVASTTNPQAITLRWGGYIRSALIVPPEGKYYFEASFPTTTGAYGGLLLTAQSQGPARLLADEWGRNGSFYRYSHSSAVLAALGAHVGFFVDREAQTFRSWTPASWLEGGLQCHGEIQDHGPLVAGLGRMLLPDVPMGGSPYAQRNNYYDRSVTHLVNFDIDTFTYDLPMGHEPLPALKNGLLNTDPYPYDYPMDWLSASAADAANHPVIWQLKTRSTFVFPPSAQIVSALTVSGQGSYTFAVTCPELNGEVVTLAEGEVLPLRPALGLALVPNAAPIGSLAEAATAGYPLLWLADSPELQAAGGRVVVQVKADVGTVTFTTGSTELLTAPLTGTGPWRIVTGTDASGDPDGRITAALDFDGDQLPTALSRAWA